MMAPMKDLQNDQELHLRDQIGFAGLVNQLRDLEHGFMHRRVLQLVINDQAEQQAQARQQAAVKQQ